MKTLNANLFRYLLILGLASGSTQLLAQAMPARALTVPGSNAQMPAWGTPKSPASYPAMAGQTSALTNMPGTPGWDVSSSSSCSEQLAHERGLTALLKRKIAILEAMAAAKSGGAPK